MLIEKEGERVRLQFCFLSDQLGDFKVDWEQQTIWKNTLKINCLLSFPSTPLSLQHKVSVGGRACVNSKSSLCFFWSLCYTLLKMHCLSLWSAVSVLGGMPVFTFVFFLEVSLTLARSGKSILQDSTALNMNTHKKNYTYNSLHFNYNSQHVKLLSRFSTALQTNPVGLPFSYGRSFIGFPFGYILMSGWLIQATTERDSWPVTEPEASIGGFCTSGLFSITVVITIQMARMHSACKWIAESWKLYCTRACYSMTPTFRSSDVHKIKVQTLMSSTPADE